jgi:hypothetical protein
MAAETENTLSKVDSLVEETGKKTRRASSLAVDVKNITDLGKFDGCIWRDRQAGDMRS